ncbi:MAG: Sir2 family NAD-dependent protein deacetylase [Actinomycetota bacterium]|nr:Sir2 family NAD-dependent protein deacetylase [Actinomycetota bacterium]
MSENGLDRGTMSGHTAEAVARARALVDEAARVVVLTGAGVSTDSGIPDFRGPNGVWTRNPAAEKRATLEHWMSDRQVRVERWQSMIDGHPNSLREPNPGHHAIVHLETRGKLDTLITQNVDGLHHAAGSDPSKVVEIHGNTREVNCLSCDDRAPMERLLERVRAGEDDPSCRSCGGILKTATISFGQALVASDLDRASEAARRADLLLAVGSTLSVYPIAGVVPVAKRSGAEVVIVNLEPTEMDELADVVVTASISAVLPSITGAA